MPNMEQGGPRWPVLSFDPEWLAISRAFHPWLSTTRYQLPFPEEADARAMVSKELDWVMKNVKTKYGDTMPVSECQTFAPTAPGPGTEGAEKYRQREPSMINSVGAHLTPFISILAPWYTNPQTVAFCAMLELENKINPPPPGTSPRRDIAVDVSASNPKALGDDNSAELHIRLPSQVQ